MHIVLGHEQPLQKLSHISTGPPLLDSLDSLELLAMPVMFVIPVMSPVVVVPSGNPVLPDVACGPPLVVVSPPDDPVDPVDPVSPEPLAPVDDSPVPGVDVLPIAVVVGTVAPVGVDAEADPPNPVSSSPDEQPGPSTSTRQAKRTCTCIRVLRAHRLAFSRA